MKTVVFASAFALGAIIFGAIALVMFASRQITIVSTALVKAPKHLVADNVRFFNRYAAWAPFSYGLQEQGEETVITKTFVAPMPPPMNAIGVLISLEGKMRAANERGLERLKSYTKKNAVALEKAH